jgi:hypothetical protein
MSEGKEEGGVGDIKELLEALALPTEDSEGESTDEDEGEERVLWEIITTACEGLR